MTIRNVIKVEDRGIYLCIDYAADLQKMLTSALLSPGGYGFRYSILHNGKYILSIRKKYVLKNEGDLFDIDLWWKSTTLLSLDFLQVSDKNAKVMANVGPFLVWCGIIPYFR